MSSLFSGVAGAEVSFCSKENNHAIIGNKPKKRPSILASEILDDKTLRLLAIAILLAEAAAAAFLVCGPASSWRRSDDAFVISNATRGEAYWMNAVSALSM